MYEVDWFYLHPEFTAYPSIKNNIAVIKLSRKLPKSGNKCFRELCRNTFKIKYFTSRSRNTDLHGPEFESSEDVERLPIWSRC